MHVPQNRDQDDEPEPLAGLLNIVCNLRRLFNLTRGILLCSLKVSTATTLGLLASTGFCSLAGFCDSAATSVSTASASGFPPL